MKEPVCYVCSKDETKIQSFLNRLEIMGSAVQYV